MVDAPSSPSFEDGYLGYFPSSQLARFWAFLIRPERDYQGERYSERLEHTNRTFSRWVYSSSSSISASASSAFTSTAESLRFIEWDWVGAATEGDRGMGVGVSMGSKAAGGGVGSRGAIPALWRTSSRLGMNSKKWLSVWVDLTYPEVDNEMWTSLTSPSYHIYMCTSTGVSEFASWDIRSQFLHQN